MGKNVTDTDGQSMLKRELVWEVNKEVNSQETIESVEKCPNNS